MDYRVHRVTAMLGVLVAALGVATTSVAPTDASALTPTGQLASSALRASRPTGFVRACGKVNYHRRRVRVDIGEGDGRAVSCKHARDVMQQFMRTQRRTQFTRFGYAWSCYVARRDGQGWGYHCMTLDPYVDIAADRRW